MYYLGTWLDKHIKWRTAIFSIIEPRSLDREGLAGTPRGDLPRQTYKLGECETVTVCPDLSPLICTVAPFTPLLCSSTRKRGLHGNGRFPSQPPAAALDQTSRFGSTGSSERPTQSTASSEIEEITDKVIRGPAATGAPCNGLPRESWDFANFAQAPA